jgi:hypothetical protein
VELRYWPVRQVRRAFQDLGLDGGRDALLFLESGASNQDWRSASSCGASGQPNQAFGPFARRKVITPGLMPSRPFQVVWNMFTRRARRLLAGAPLHQRAPIGDAVVTSMPRRRSRSWPTSPSATSADWSLGASSTTRSPL